MGVATHDTPTRPPSSTEGERVSERATHALSYRHTTHDTRASARGPQDQPVLPEPLALGMLRPLGGEVLGEGGPGRRREGARLLFAARFLLGHVTSVPCVLRNLK